MMSAPDALQRLREGNLRFVSAAGNEQQLTSVDRRGALAAGQRAFAIILGCADARVAPEIVFDTGLGELFVVRVAGNIATPSQIESVEFAAVQFGIRLVVVLGHSQCAAVQATIDALRRGQRTADDAGVIVECISPSVEGLLGTGSASDGEALLSQGVRANIKASANQLRHGSAALEQLIQADGLAVIGAEYSVETGRADFFEDLPAVD